LIKPAVEEFGFSALRADQEARAGIITTHVIQRLVNSELVVADLTGRNPNVFYELAVRHVTRKPLIQIIREDEDIPFDVQSMRTVKFQLADPDILKASKKELGRHVEAVKDEDQLDTPISQAVELQIAKESDDPDQVSIATLAGAVQDLTAEVRSRSSSKAETPLLYFQPHPPESPDLYLPTLDERKSTIVEDTLARLREAVDNPPPKEEEEPPSKGKGGKGSGKK
jgi:hypothetical protein